MKTLLLMSHGQFLNHDLPGVLGRPLAGLRVLHVITAAKGTHTDMSSFWKTVHDAFSGYGCLVEDLDIEGLHEDELRILFSRADIIFVNGGNTFYLLKAIRESGFEKILKEFLPQGLIYMGASAGAYVACPTIESATWKSNKNRVGLTDFTAMNLVPFLLTVHYVNEHHDLLKEKINDTNYQTKILTDDQAVLVRDDVFEFLGGEEIKIN